MYVNFTGADYGCFAYNFIFVLLFNIISLLMIYVL